MKVSDYSFNFLSCDVSVKIFYFFLVQFWKVDPAIPLLGIHTEETRIEKDTCTPVFITAVFIVARTQTHPRCPLVDE